MHSHSRGMICPSFAFHSALSSKRAQGKPGARCTRGLVCNSRIATHTSIQVQRRHSGFPCAMGYGLYVLSPARLDLVVTVLAKPLARPARRHLPLWRQACTTSPSASRALVSCAFSVHRIPPRVRDVRNAPLIGWDAQSIHLSCPYGKPKYFCREGLRRRANQ